MKVLVVAAPLVGHLLPLLPLAGALRDAGHEVLLAHGGDPVDAGTLPVRDVARRVSMPRIALRTTLAAPQVIRATYAGRAGTRVAGDLFGGANAKMIDEVGALADEWRPDLVVHEPLAASGAVAAARRGVPAVLAENSLWDGPDLVAATARNRSFRRAAVAAGVTALPAPAAVLTMAPASVVGPRAGLPMRPVPPVSGGAAPAWLLRRPDRQRVIVSHTTVLGAAPADPMPAVAAVAADLDAEIVLVRPGKRLLRRGLPPNVRTVGWVPLPAALPHADLFVHHGGAGSVLAGLAAGVPQLVSPGPGDQPFNAERVAARGAGACVPAREITADHLRALLDDAGAWAAAGEVAAEIAAMPSPAERVPDLEALT